MIMSNALIKSIYKMYFLLKETTAAFAQKTGYSMRRTVTTFLLNGKLGKRVKIIVLLGAPDF